LFLSKFIRQRCTAIVKAAQVFKLIVDESPAVAQRYGIQEISILILFQDGVEKERILGVASQEKISRAIDRYIRATPITPPIWNGSRPPP